MALLTGAVDVGCGSTYTCNFLEVQCLDKSEELVFSILNGIVDETVGEKHRVVRHLDLSNSLANTNFEFLLGLNSVSDTATQFLKARWVDEQEVALKCLFVDLDCALNIDLDDGNLAS